MPVAILLAAGASHRMGRDKMVLPWRGGTVLGCAVSAFRECDEVIVVTRPGFVPPPDVTGVRFVVNPDPSEGMASSLRCGVLAAPDADAWLLGLGDMPDLTPVLVRTVRDAFAGGIVVPVFEGRRGHPVMFGARYREALLTVRADVGAREIVRSNAADVVQVTVSDPAILRDLDTPEDLRR